MPVERTRTSRVWAILALAAGLRLLILAQECRHPAPFREPDAADYHRLALGLLRDATYGTPDQPEVFRAPAYPAFLAGVYAFAGPDPRAALALQVLADLLLCFLVLRWTAELAGPDHAGAPVATDSRAAAWAGLWQALAIGSAVYANRLLSDSLFALGLFAALRLTLGLLARPPAERGRGHHAVLLGLGMGVLVLWRAAALPVAGLLLAFLAVRPGCRRRAALAAAGLAAVLLPWVARNALRTGYVGVSTVGAINLYRYDAAGLLARREGVPFAEQQARVDRELAACASQTEQAELSRRRGLAVALRSPIGWLRLHVEGGVHSLLPAGTELLRSLGVECGGGTLAVLNSEGLAAAVRHHFRGHPEALAAVLPDAGLTALKYALAALGLALCWRTRSRYQALLLAATVAGFLLLPGPAGHPRFRVPVEPLLSVWAGLGTAALLAWGRRKAVS